MGILSLSEDHTVFPLPPFFHLLNYDIRSAHSDLSLEEVHRLLFNYAETAALFYWVGSYP